MDDSTFKTVLKMLEEMQNRVAAVESENALLKKDITDVKSLNDIGRDVAKEIADEVDLLRQNGVKIRHLDKKAALLQVRGKRGRSAKPLTKDEILDVQKISVSGSEAARKLGVTYPTYKKYAVLFGIHTLISFPPPKGVKPPGMLVSPYKGKYPIDDILQNKWPEFPIHRLKDKLIRSGKKESCCEQCGFKERRITDGKIPLLLNFDDGNKKNHRIENLKILCYNCTFVSGNGYVKHGLKSFDPDVMQDSKKILNARF